ncbi:MAG: hypothetical protein JW999_00085 [Methanotrichaceae archaeon]|nr:hypothetical protein [Methanotrichaceae archaeon]
MHLHRSFLPGHLAAKPHQITSKCLDGDVCDAEELILSVMGQHLCKLAPDFPRTQAPAL